MCLKPLPHNLCDLRQRELSHADGPKTGASDYLLTLRYPWYEILKHETDMISRELDWEGR